MNQDHLRPIERTVLNRAEDGMSHAEIAWRLRRSPGAVDRILALTELDRNASSFTSTNDGGLRPIERCILSARDGGTSTAEIAARLRKSPGYVSRVEGYANYKLSRKVDRS